MIANHIQKTHRLGVFLSCSDKEDKQVESFLAWAVLEKSKAEDGLSYAIVKDVAKNDIYISVMLLIQIEQQRDIVKVIMQ
jgi:uncharacterized protein YejL (UPF0352 family)